MLKPCATPAPADWIVNSELAWHDLVGFGPAGFDAYARLRFVPDSDAEDDSGSDGPSADQAKVGKLCALMRSATQTPDDCYFALWTGWPDISDVMYQSAQMRIPNRNYHLLHGPLSDFGQWGLREKGYNPAAFIWPADHAWCIASDVDDHWAGIGASTHTIDRLLTQHDLDIVTADPDAGTPAQYARHRVVE